jgi:hypothetical protein
MTVQGGGKRRPAVGQIEPMLAAFIKVMRVFASTLTAGPALGPGIKPTVR